MNNRIELLAPAGDIDIAKAAINAGADAVYIGGRWSARAYAKNLNDEEIGELVRYAHLRGRKVYVALNTMLYNSELQDALDYTAVLQGLRVDAIIASDLGYISEVGKRFSIPIHASTQLSVSSKEGAEFLKNLGVTRIVPARECSFAEIDEMKRTGLEIELFCHGALCSSVSGACLISGMISDRSGNRGTCAQICRQKFLHDDREGHFLNTRDLCTVSLVDTFIRKGITSLKIEGRMKNVDYVVSTVRNYRKLIDEGASDAEQIMDELRISFNRGGFTAGYFRGKKDVDYISDNSHKGLLVGTVRKAEKGRILVECTYPLGKGDSIEIDGRGFRIEKAELMDGLTCIHTRESFAAGQKVYLKQSEALLQKNRISGSDDYRREVRFRLDAEEGKKAVLSAESNGSEAAVSADIPETAKKEPSSELMEKSLRKTGGTIYDVSEVEIHIKGTPFISTSLLNSMRRDVLEKLDDRILSGFSYADKEYSPCFRERKETAVRYIAVETDDGRSIDGFDPEKVSRIYFIPRTEADLGLFRERKKIPMYLVVPPFISEASGKLIRQMISSGRYQGLKGIVGGNINSFSLAYEYGLDLVTDYWQNVSNDRTIRLLEDTGASNITYSTECDIWNLSGNDNDSLEMLVYGNMDLMNICHDIEGFSLDDIRKGRAEISNGGNSFSLRSTYLGRDYLRLCNGKTLYITETDRIREKGISGIRLIYSDNRPFADILDYYYRSFIIGEKATPPKIGGVTRGHFTKGVN